MLVYHPTKFSCYRGYESKDKFINVFIPYRDGCHWRLLGSIRACWSFILLNIVVECWRTFGIGDKAINGSRVFFKKVGVTSVLAAETTKPTAFLFLSDTTSYNKIKVNRNNSSTHEENFSENYQGTMNKRMFKRTNFRTVNCYSNQSSKEIQHKVISWSHSL